MIHKGFMLVVRDLLGEAIEQTKQNPPLAAEIGVARGVTSALLLRTYPTLRLYMVDPWSYDEAYMKTLGYASQRKFSSQGAWDTIKRQALSATEFAADRRIVWQTTSLDGAKRIDDGMLCLAFIDAVHTTGAVTADIAAWWPKLCVGGCLCGDDYCIGGVRRAAHRWAEQAGLKIQIRDKVWWAWKE